MGTDYVELQYIIYQYDINILFFRSAFINIKEFMDQDIYYEQARYRINKMRVFLLNKNEEIISNSNQSIKIGVRYPLIFNDIDREKNHHIFRSQKFFCRSIYKTYGNIIEQCEIDVNFNKINYQTTPDGMYEFILMVILLNIY